MVRLLQIVFINLDDLVQCNNLVLSVGEVMKQQMETKPDAKIAYHKVEYTNVDGAEAGAFQCILTHKVYIVNIKNGLESISIIMRASMLAALAKGIC